MLFDPPLTPTNGVVHPVNMLPLLLIVIYCEKGGTYGRIYPNRLLMSLLVVKRLAIIQLLRYWKGVLMAEIQNEEIGSLTGIAAGALAGASVGSMIFPVVGTFAGALFGGIVGSQIGKTVGGVVLNAVDPAQSCAESSAANNANVISEL